MNALKQYRETSPCASPRTSQQGSKMYIKDNRKEIATQRELIGAIQQKKNSSFKLNGMALLNSNSYPLQRDLPDTATGVVGFGNVTTHIAGLLDFFFGGFKAIVDTPNKRRYILETTLTINNIQGGVVDGGEKGNVEGEEEELGREKITGGSISIASGDITLESGSFTDESGCRAFFRKALPFVVSVAGGLTAGSSMAAICKAAEKIVSGLSAGAAIGYATPNVVEIIQWLRSKCCSRSRSAPIEGA